MQALPGLGIEAPQISGPLLLVITRRLEEASRLLLLFLLPSLAPSTALVVVWQVPERLFADPLAFTWLLLPLETRLPAEGIGFAFNRRHVVLGPVVVAILPTHRIVEVLEMIRLTVFTSIAIGHAWIPLNSFLIFGQ